VVDYISMSVDVSALIAEVGVQVQVTRKSAGIYDEISQKTISPAPTEEFLVSAVLDNPTTRSNSYISEKIQTLFKSGDQILIMVSGVYSPEPLDKILLPNGEIFRVIESDSVRPGGVDILHMVLARK